MNTLRELKKIMNEEQVQFKMVKQETNSFSKLKKYDSRKKVLENKIKFSRKQN